MRNAALLLVAPLLLLLFTTASPGPLPAPTLPAAFDGAGALQLTGELADGYPDRTPGSPGAQRAARWYQERLALYGLEVASDRWRADVPGVGTVELTNLVTVVPGAKDETIVVVAHRDNKGTTAGANDNASGTAALIELLRGYAATGTLARRLEPEHTLVFLSSDGGAYGGIGARRFAERSTLAARAVAVVSLDGLAGRAWPRLEIAGTASSAAAPALVRTATVRAREQLGDDPALPGVLTQLVDLGLPFGYGEQASFDAVGRSALRLSTAPDAPGDAADQLSTLDPARLTRLGRAVETTLASLDAAIQLPGRSAPFVYAGDRVVRGWTVELLFLAALVPFAAAVVDLLVRAFRRGTRLAPAWRDLRRRLGAALSLGGAVFVAALAGVLPRPGAGPPVADAPPLEPVPVAGSILLATAMVGIVLLCRRARGPQGVGEEEPTGAFTVALVALAVVAAVTALVNPFALVFVLPSLYAWLWLPALQRRPAWLSDIVFGLGLAGPVLALVVVEEQLDLGARAPLYLLGLATSGTVPWLLSLCALAWAAVAAQLAVVVSGTRDRAV